MGYHDRGGTGLVCVFGRTRQELGSGEPPHVAYNPMEEALALDSAGGLAGNVSYTCRTLFG